jgi:cyanophycin synthetase
LECARGGILRAGLAFDKCDISIITNITADHLGLNGIDTLDELAKVKSVVARSTFKTGYAILNADDDLVYKMKDELDCNVALFSMYENNERIISHCDEGGLAAIIEKGYFTLCKGAWRMRVAKVKEVPLTLDGRVSSMIKNILPAILTAAIRDFDIRTLRKALLSFIPGAEQTPGRMNIFHFKNYDLMIDYAHNTDGFVQLAEFMKTVESPEKIGIITSPGDRRDEDIEEAGYLASKMFDKIIIRHDNDTRGRTQENITGLLKKGIFKNDSQKNVQVISDEIDSIKYAMDHAGNGAFVIACSDKVKESIEFVTGVYNEEKKSTAMIA